MPGEKVKSKKEKLGKGKPEAPQAAAMSWPKLYLAHSRSARPLPRGFTGHVAHPSRSILAAQGCGHTGLPQDGLKFFLSRTRGDSLTSEFLWVPL